MIFLNSSFIMQKLTSFFKPIENSAEKRKTRQEDIDTNESTEPSEPQQVKSRSSSSSKQTFQPGWKKMYPWLSYHRDGKMFCNECLESPNLSNSGSSFVTGCDNFKIESLGSYAKSKGHVNAKEAHCLDVRFPRMQKLILDLATLTSFWASKISCLLVSRLAVKKS